jgi:integrase
MAKKIGRRKGSRTKGYYYRKGRGWYAKDGTRNVPLIYPSGEHIRERNAAPEAVKEAFERWKTATQIVKQNARKADARDAAITLERVCDLYLSHVQMTGSEATHYSRANTLFDLCYGIPAKFRRKKGESTEFTAEEKRAMQKERCEHPPYGNLPAIALTPLHVDEWFNAHPTWERSRRTRVQALKRALNYAVERKLIPYSPIKGYVAGKSGSRVTYFTDEQEAALMKHANPALRMALQVCIRTGLRYGIEFTTLTKDRVSDMGDRMEWRVTPKKTKTTQKYRIVRVTAQNIIAIVRQQMKLYPTGPIFRNRNGEPWTQSNLTTAFIRLRRRVEKKEQIQFDPDVCMYTCRHAYAKRTLQGYWTGKATTVETLAKLLGNTPQVCWKHYVQWCDSYTEPLWEAT